MQATKHLHKNSVYNLQALHMSLPTSAENSPRDEGQRSEQVLTKEGGGRRTAPVFRMGAVEELAAATQEDTTSGNEYAPRGLRGPPATGVVTGGKNPHNWGLGNVSAFSLNQDVQFDVQYSPSAALQVEVAAPPAFNMNTA